MFLQPDLAGQLRVKIIDEDLRYAREVTPEEAARFEAPDSVIERFRRSLGQFFEAHL